jgi:hypothetical protein
VKKTARDLMERVANTAVAAFIGALPVTIPLTNDALSAAGWAGLTAAIAAVLALVKNLVLASAGTASANIVERFAWTAAQAFVAAIPATFALTVDDTRAIALAGVNAAVAAVLSLAKNLTAEGTVVEATRRAGGGGEHAGDLDSTASGF